MDQPRGAEALVGGAAGMGGRRRPGGPAAGRHLSARHARPRERGGARRRRRVHRGAAARPPRLHVDVGGLSRRDGGERADRRDRRVRAGGRRHAGRAHARGLRRAADPRHARARVERLPRQPRAAGARQRRGRAAMSTDVTVETAIAPPRGEGDAYASDWRNDPPWVGAGGGGRVTTPAPFGVGARIERIAHFLGRRIEYENEVELLEPERRLVMRSVRAPFPMTVTYEWEDAPGGSVMRIRAQGDASGFYRLAGPLL